MNILITGGTGFIGQYLVPVLTQKGHQVTLLSRRERESRDRLVSYRTWNGKAMPPALGIYDVVINLAGSSLGDGKWTEERKKVILQSRLDATQACVDFINGGSRPPQLFISASAVGYYGVEPSGVLDEDAAPGKDFAAEVCRQWEEVSQHANTRVINPRIGVVLGKDGGALERMLPIYKAYLGGRFASGKQGFPWIHMDDIVRAFVFMIESETLSGPLNLAAPETVDQAQFSKALAKALGTLELFIVPKFGLKLLFGEQSQLMYGGQKVRMDKLTNAGFSFAFPELAPALADLVS
ncbi:MAG: TIGR01777 family oxidoreductase [Bacteroidota bacterium]